MITDQDSVFVSNVIHEIADVLGIRHRQAITKHRQTIGVLERTEATMKTSLKMSSEEFRKQWHQYLPLPLLSYNTTFYASKGCEPIQIFHGKIF